MTRDSLNTSTEAPENGDPQRTAGSGWLGALRAKLGLGEPPSLRSSLEDALEEDDASASFSPGEREMLLRLLRFGSSRVEDVMVQRADIIAIEESAPLRELLETFESAGVSRVPVFHETFDDPRGMIHIKDLFRWLMSEVRAPQFGPAWTKGAMIPDQHSPSGGPSGGPAASAKLDATQCDLSRPVRVADIRRPMLYVPPSMPAANLLIRMQAKRIHMALVVDEYGGTDGLVTIEDLVEQIVGDIEDEHDETEAAHIAIDPKLGLVASARTPIDAIETHLGIKLLGPGEDEEIDTVGGLVFSLVGRIPAKGERVRHASGLEFEVLDADQRRLKKLRLHVPREGGAGETPLPIVEGR